MRISLLFLYILAATFGISSYATSFFKLEVIRYSLGMSEMYLTPRWNHASAEEDLRRRTLQNSRAAVEGEKREIFGVRPSGLFWISALEESSFLGGSKRVDGEISVAGSLRSTGLLLTLAPENWSGAEELKSFNIIFSDLRHYKKTFAGVPGDAIELEVLGRDVHPRLNAEWREKIRNLANQNTYTLELEFTTNERRESLRLTGDLLTKFMREKSICNTGLSGPQSTDSVKP